MRSVTVLSFALSLAAAATAHATCEVSSDASRLHLVELYTSDGCDSCPPAERWMSSLHKHPELVGLEFHVDYWDSSDWRDPYDNAAYTRRQEQLSRRFNRNQYYTPQIWLDGQPWHNWPKGAPPSPYDGPAPALQLVVDDRTPIHARVDASNTTGNTETLRLFVGMTEDGLSHFVRGGENRGKTLSDDQVVRAFAGPFPLPRAEADLTLPAKADPARMNVVAFVQDEQSGSVVGVVRLPLSQCRK